MSELVLMALVNGILLGGVLALLGFGMNLMFGVVKIIHMAYGQFVMLGVYLIYTFYTLLHFPLLLSCAVVVLVMAVVGLITQRFIVSPLLSSNRLNQLLALAGLILIVENFALFAWGADYITIQLNLPIIQFGDLFIRTSFLMGFIGALIVLGLLYLFLKKTYVGLAIRSATQDMEMAKLMGIKPASIYYITLALGSALTGVVASFFVPIYAVYPQFGGSFTVSAFIIVVLGGMGNLMGGFISAFIIGIVTSVVAVVTTTEIAQIVVLVLFIAIMIVRPQGLLGEVS
ncbi:MAG: branched-chain amino acid ABC transporter permease [Syntrophales bacterium]|jgi:branched-chain amino acid transport system permease protein|nr:branched-chain amino acid ABC transporter permease [Syntrophales bacterium]